jgi:hypothetical protein
MNDIKYLVKEWLNGSELEYRATNYCEWQTMEKNDPINPMSYGECYHFRVKPKVKDKWKPKGKLPKGYLTAEKMHIPIPKSVRNYDKIQQFVNEFETDWDKQDCEVYKEIFEEKYETLTKRGMYVQTLGTIRMSEQCAEKLCEMLNNGEIEL